MADTPPLLAAALRYAARGWPVFPCKPGAKVPATPHGCKDATTDPDTIKLWWARLPTANVAIATGTPGPDVVDIDVKHGAPGQRSRDRLARAGLLRGAFAEIATPTGGQHLYYLGSGQRNSARARAGVDFRSTGGYVLAPPSAVAGAPYRCADVDMSAAGPVDWTAIAAFLDPPKPAKRPRAAHTGAGAGDYAGVCRAVATAIPGERNQVLYWAACRLADGNAVEADYQALAQAAHRAGLGERETGRTIASAREGAAA